MKQNFYIEEVSWATHEPALRLIREQVFIVEQHVPTWVEWDALDAPSIHLLALDEQQQPIACARILETGRVGRMGVLKAWRGLGLGQALLTKAIEICKARKLSKVILSSQTHAIPFYEKAGFVVTSEAYIDVNIWHVDMQLVF
ncbi:MAG: GNAT family N-acetyltransferase [Methylophilaceae bacterium]